MAGLQRLNMSGNWFTTTMPDLRSFLNATRDSLVTLDLSYNPLQVCRHNLLFWIRVQQCLIGTLSDCGVCLQRVLAELAVGWPVTSQPQAHKQLQDVGIQCVV
jgi:hypothetical protein